MNYALIMTEGTTESAFLEVLLHKKMLRFKTSELFMEEVFHKRQIDPELVGYIQILPPGDQVDIYRVGDKLSDKIKIPDAILEDKIGGIHKVCTLPEFEVLFLLNEGHYEEYQKLKSKIKPSDFYKTKNASYRKQASFVKDYFENMSIQEITHLIRLYVMKRGKTHKKDQQTLSFLLQ